MTTFRMPMLILHYVMLFLVTSSHSQPIGGIYSENFNETILVTSTAESPRLILKYIRAHELSMNIDAVVNSRGGNTITGIINKFNSTFFSTGSKLYNVSMPDMSCNLSGIEFKCDIDAAGKYNVVIPNHPDEVLCASRIFGNGGLWADEFSRVLNGIDKSTIGYTIRVDDGLPVRVLEKLNMCVDTMQTHGILLPDDLMEIQGNITGRLNFLDAELHCVVTFLIIKNLQDSSLIAGSIKVSSTVGILTLDLTEVVGTTLSFEISTEIALSFSHNIR